MRIGLGFAAACALALGTGAGAVAKDAKDKNVRAITDLSPAEMERVRTAGAQILFWSDEQRSANFRAMEKQFPGTIAKAGRPRALPRGKPLAVRDADVDAFMAAQNVAGLMVIQNGKVLLERYGLGMTATDRWTSFSVAKSFTSTLLGAAVKDGFITSIDDPVIKYLPELAGSGYDGVSIKHILTMTSGVKWNEDYTDPNSDVVKMLSVPVGPGEDPNTAYLKTLPSEAGPGSKWVYKTGETNLIGVIVTRATGKSLTEYAQEKIVRPAGFEDDLFWMVDSSGQNIGGCCLSLRLADYARMGLFALEGGGKQVPDGWFAQAGKEQANVGMPGFGYGYQWWTYPGGTWGGQGIFGQGIMIVPQKKLVIAVVSNWPKASGADFRIPQLQFFQKLAQAAK
ncbi:serine hydrolase domain-containing protein [Blastomonas sp.]|uniref:serine hydrolase domain-containing protein n=1 Tax=Blastomonas sp. TaxID=1909299 RepID=UPI003594355C